MKAPWMLQGRASRISWQEEESVRGEKSGYRAQGWGLRPFRGIGHARPLISMLR
jgi:hypothetical protein